MRTPPHYPQCCPGCNSQTGYKRTPTSGPYKHCIDCGWSPRDVAQPARKLGKAGRPPGARAEPRAIERLAPVGYGGSPISAQYACTAEQIEFAKGFVAGLTGAEAYRRATKKPSCNERTAVATAARWRTLPQVVAYIRELQQPGGDAARRALIDQVKLGEGGDQRRAAERILDDEDKLGFRDAVTEFWRVSADVGAVIDVPFPATTTGMHTCSACGALDEVTLPVRATVPLAGLFPQFQPEEASPCPTPASS